MVDLYDIADADYRKWVMGMLERHQHMWSGNLEEIKSYRMASI